MSCISQREIKGYPPWQTTVALSRLRGITKGIRTHQLSEVSILSHGLICIDEHTLALSPAAVRAGIISGNVAAPAWDVVPPPIRNMSVTES